MVILYKAEFLSITLHFHWSDENTIIIKVYNYCIILLIDITVSVEYNKQTHWKLSLIRIKIIWCDHVMFWLWSWRITSLYIQFTVMSCVSCNEIRLDLEFVSENQIHRGSWEISLKSYIKNIWTSHLSLIMWSFTFIDKLVWSWMSWETHLFWCQRVKMNGSEAVLTGQVWSGIIRWIFSQNNC